MKQIQSKYNVSFDKLIHELSLEELYELRDMINEKLNDVTMQLQMHKFIWDPDKRGV